MDTQQAIIYQIDQLNARALGLVYLDYDQANALANKAFDLLASLEQPYALGYMRALSFRVVQQRRDNHFTEVIQLCREIRQFYATHPTDRFYAHTLYELGIALYSTGQYAEALEAHQEQLKVAVENHYVASEAAALRRIGVIHGELGDLDRQLDYYQRSLEVYESIDDMAGVAGVLNNMSITYRKLQQTELSLTTAKKSLTLFEAVNHAAGKVNASTNVSSAYLERDEPRAASTFVEMALETARQSKLDRLIVTALNEAGHVQCALENYDDALIFLKEARAIAEKSGHQILLARTLELMSQAYANKHNYEKAYLTYQAFHNVQSRLFELASQQRYEALEVAHELQRVQDEAENERRLREKERRYYEEIARMKDELFNAATHDLKNPIASLILMTNLLRDHIASDNKHGRRLLERIETNVYQMRDLVVDLLDLARLESNAKLEYRSQDIVSFVQNILSNFEEIVTSKDLALRLETSLNYKPIVFDQRRIEQTLNNLISNAIKYTPHGSIVISIEDAAPDGVMLKVADSGIGIPAKDLPHIFNRFYRVDDDLHASVEGTGLGLAICKSIVEQHGGKIWVESVPDKGSEFAFTLPVNEEKTSTCSHSNAQ